MKKLLLTLCILGLIFNVQAQINTYFLNNPIWQQTSACSAPAPCIKNETYNYFTNGDTLINSLLYKKIFKQGMGSYIWMAPPPPNPGCFGSYWYIDTVASFFLRSAGKQIFVRLPSDTSEYLLYDFDLAIGDTLPLSYNNYDNAVTVTAIDSFYTSNGYRKQFTLAGNTWSQYLIEGVGHSKGLIETMQVPLECGYNLECYSLNDTAYFPSFGPTCFVAVGENEIRKDNTLIIYPNPFFGQTTLQTKEQLKNATLSLRNIFGQTVKEIKNISGQTIDFFRDNMPSGIYFLYLQEGNRIIEIQKIVITD